MSSTMLRRPRRARRRHSVKGPLLALILIAALIAVGVYYIGAFPKQVEEVLYPLKYEDLMRRYADEYSLDPARVAAVVYCESSFRPEAISSVGAVGLMQIMPSTGEWIAEKLGEANYAEEKLLDPETNIRFGCWYLNYLNNRFDGDITKVTAAYHAGGGRVDQWLEDAQYSADGVSLEAIPYKATSAYVSKVKEIYEKYKEIMKA